MSVKSKGTKLQLEIASIFTDIANLVQVSTSGTDVETYDDTLLDQTAAGRSHEATGFVEGGNVPFQIFFDPVAATLQALTDLLTTPAKVNWKIIWSDTAGTTWAFAGILKKCDVSADRSNGLVADCDIKISGLISYPT